MDRLSPEIRSLICSKFTAGEYKALLNLSATSRLWYHTVSDDLIWTRLCYQVRNSVVSVDELAPYTSKRHFKSNLLNRCIVCGRDGGHNHDCDFKSCFLCFNCTTSSKTPFGYLHVSKTQAKECLIRKEIEKLPPSEWCGNKLIVLIKKVYPDSGQYYAHLSRVKESRETRERRRKELRAGRDIKANKMLDAAGLVRSEAYWPLFVQLGSYGGNGLNAGKLKAAIDAERVFRSILKRLELDGKKVIWNCNAAVEFCSGVNDCQEELEEELRSLDKEEFGLSKN